MEKCQHNNRKLLMILSAMAFAVFASLLVFSSDTYAASASVYFDDVEEAGEYLRDAMVDRENDVVIYCTTALGSASDVAEELNDIVNEHTWEGDEGDYLITHTTNYSITVTGYTSSKTYNGTKYYKYKCATTGWRSTSDMEAAVTKKVNSIYTSLKLGSTALSDYEKIVAIHDYIRDNTVYNEDAENCYTAYGVFCDGEAVCQGYAQAFYRLAIEAGIDCYYVAVTKSDGSVNHAWNVVELYGSWYYVDVTWDDSLKTDYYFLKGTQDFGHYDYPSSGAYYNSSIISLVSDYGYENAISDATLSYTSCTYTGSARKPSVTVTDSSGETLTKGTDYTVEYENNINVGTATVTITGAGDYTGTITKTFTIIQASISGATIYISKNKSSYTNGNITCTYTGSEITPYVKVELNGSYLSSSNYTVAYSDNTDVGTATVKITGDGNYTGTITKTFTISKASISSADVTLAATEYAYTSKAITPAVKSVEVDGITLTEGTDYTVSYSNNTLASTAAVVKITGKGNYTGTVKTYFTIYTTLASENAQVTLSETTYTYDGNACEPEVTVTTAEGTTLTQGTDYKVSYTNNINVGTATVIITGIGHYKGIITQKYYITDTTSASSPVYLYVVGYDCGNGVIEPYDNYSAYIVRDGRAIQITSYKENTYGYTTAYQGTSVKVAFADIASQLSGVSWSNFYAKVSLYSVDTSTLTIDDVIASIPDSDYRCWMRWVIEEE